MIQIRIRQETDLYNPYDPTGTKINDGVYRYLKSFCTELEAPKHLHDTLQIVAEGPVDEERFRTALQNAVQKDREEFDGQIARNNRAMWRDYLTGIILSALGFALSVILDQVLLALISFLGTMAIRDALTIQLKVNPDLKRLKTLLEPFRDVTLEVAPAGEGGGLV